MMITELAEAQLSPGLWGHKAARLSALAAAGLAVPRALCLRPGAVSDLRSTRFLDRWVRSCSGDRIVLRSSTEDEDTADDAGAGRTCSILNLPPSATHLIRVIRDDIEPGLAACRGGRSCIMQEQVPCVLGGVAFRTADALLVEGNYNSSTFTTGGETPEFRLVVHSGVRRWEMTDNSMPHQPFARQIERLSLQTFDLLREPVDLEWVFDGRMTYLVQARPLTARIPSELF